MVVATLATDHEYYFYQEASMKVKEFIKELQRLKPSLQESEIKIECPNGLMVTPKAKMWVDLRFSTSVKGVVIAP